MFVTVIPSIPGDARHGESSSNGLRLGLWPVVALLFLGIPPASAQGNRPFEDLGRYLRAGTTVFVVERTEGASEGVVSRVTPTEVFVSVSGQERRLTRDTVAWIERPDPVWDGAALGGALGGLSGLFPAALAGNYWPLMFFAGVGAAIGAAGDAVERGRQLVYGRRPGFSWIRRPIPVASLGDLWSRVPPGASITVDDSSVGERRGRFVKASREALAIEIESNELVIPAERVRLVQWRRSYARGHWIWIGMAVGGVVGGVKEHDPYNRHATREDIGKGVLGGGLLGVLVAVAAARDTDVYRPGPSASQDVAVWPVVGPGRRGVALNVRF
jgi:hypothetical protein